MVQLQARQYSEIFNSYFTSRSHLIHIQRLGWKGISDGHLTENCGILDKLLPGDLILADRGFNIHESAGLFCAEVNPPPPSLKARNS